jgi:glycosyltransferase involved in cell wall biosynthesis
MKNNPVTTGSRPIRVLHCVHSLSGGGAERQLGIFIKYSKQYDIDSAVFCVNPHSYQDIDKTVPIYRAGKSRKYNMQLFSDISKTIEQYKPDIVHAWLPASMTIPSMIAAKYNKVPSIFSYRNKMRFHRPVTVPEYFTAALCASGIVSNRDTSDSMKLFKQLFRNKKGTVIHNAVDVEDKYTNTGVQMNSPHEKIILFVGRLTKQKNWQCLLDAVQSLNRNRSWKLYICGDGEDRELLLDKIKKYQMQKYVIYLGFRRDIYELMKNADFLVMPSFHEGMPNVVVEAFSIGLPCILSDIVAHRQIASREKSALFFNPKRPEELSRQIDKMLKNEELAKEIARGGRLVAEKYSPDRMMNAYKDYYCKLRNPG